MRSPFAIFRKHQRVLMVVTIGLALFAFVICSGASDPTAMDKWLVALAIICMCGGIAWVIGVPSKKSSETSIMGLIIGFALAMFMILKSGPPVVAHAETGDITRDEFSELRDHRERANQFVLRTIFETREQAEAQTLITQYQFGGLGGSPTGDRDIMTTELLRREAEALGLSVPEQAVTEYINEISGNGMTPDLFKKLRMDLGLGEDELFDILAAELQARMAAEFLYDFDFEQASRLSPTLTPEQYWRFYRRIWVQQSAEVAVIPVAEFVDESMEPPPEDLARLFNEYHDNYPNFTNAGQLEEGRFGFMQQRKVEVAFLEVVFEDVQATIAAATDEDIDAHYQENYVLPAEERAAEEAAAAAEAEMQDDDTPVLPLLELDPEPADPAGPDSDPADPDARESDGSDARPADGASDDTASDEEAPTPEEREADALESNEAPDSAQRGALPDETQFVTLQQVSEETAERAAETDGDEPTGEAVAGDPETPESADDDADPETTPESDDPSEPAGDATAVGESDPAPPESAVPPLTEALREQIRIEIRREATLEKMQNIAGDAMEAFSEFAYKTSLPKNDPAYLTAEELSDAVAGYAEDHGLYFATTPRLTFIDLQESEEYPVGGAFVEGRGTVAHTFSQSNPEDLNRADIAEGLGTDSRFVFWKVADHEAEEPASLDDEGVREQVEDAWRLEQARISARNRAEQLLVLIEGVEDDMESALGAQTTTGDENADALVVVPTGEFRWLSGPQAGRPDLYFSTPELRDPLGVTGVGPQFMETVFDELVPGDVGIAANVDRSELYLVKVLERTPWGDEEEAVFRQEFLSQPLFEGFSDFGPQFSFPSVYERLAATEAMRQRSTWVEQLWEKHGAQLLLEPS